MRKIRQTGLSILMALTLGVFAAGSGFSQERGDPDMVDRSAELAREGIEKLMRALEKFIDAIPLYGAPYINERGDIIIPRLDPKTPPSLEPDEKEGEEDGIDI